jgi:hypothetical protein
MTLRKSSGSGDRQGHMCAHVHGGVAQDTGEEGWEAGVPLYEHPMLCFVPFPNQQHPSAVARVGWGRVGGGGSMRGSGSTIFFRQWQQD